LVLDFRQKLPRDHAQNAFARLETNASEVVKQRTSRSRFRIVAKMLGIARAIEPSISPSQLRRTKLIDNV
jgi:hypothetical protein